ncbi:MAG: tetratricopeptide repeat protein [Spirochaetaceae bacterium]|nr:tetratricopeptide repeat protein [Spirochaetaceae bacterium]
MKTQNPLDSIVFISLPKDFAFDVQDIQLNTAIPLPVQKADSQNEQFDIQQLTQEMILAGILTILAYDKGNPHIDYYRSIIMAARPNIKTELAEAAILKSRNEDFDIADEIFSALRGLDPNDKAITLNSALFYDQRADFYRKMQLHDDADACDASALKFYTECLTCEEPMGDAYFNAGFFFLKQRNFSKAKECFESFLFLIEGISDEEMDENGRYKKNRAKEIIQDITTRNLEDELFSSAYTLISNGEEEKGLAKIHEFLQKNSQVWNAWFMLGWALRRLNRFDDAEKAFLQAVDCGGTNADTYNELAICCLELQKFSEAKNYLYEALSLEPENTKIISNLGFLALKEGDMHTARQFFTTVLEFDPNDKIALETLKNLN